MRKKEQTILVFSLATLLLAGCESKAGTGALAGTALGVGIGGAAGGGKGALIGGAAGLIGGRIIGGILDANDEARLRKRSLQTYRKIDRGSRLSVNDIINMSKADIQDKKIIELIEKTGSSYELNNYQIERLKKSGVSKRVIDYMLYNT